MTLPLRTPPGVYRAQDDTSLLIDEMNRGGLARGCSVLDIGTGTGAPEVTGVDLSFRAVLTARCIARLNRHHITVHRGRSLRARGRPGCSISSAPTRRTCRAGAGYCPGTG